MFNHFFNNLFLGRRDEAFPAYAIEKAYALEE